MRYALAGLGNSETTQLVTGGVSTATGIAVPLLVSANIILPGVGAAIAGAVALGSYLVNALFKPNVQKIQASNDANQIEQIMQQNLANWLSIPKTQRLQSVQQQALAVFDQAWTKYTQLVQPLLSRAPKSISDRQQGSCAYHTAQPVGWVGTTYYPNTANLPTGTCWNWFVGYRDPIAKDPNVISDAAYQAAVEAAKTGASSGGGGVVQTPTGPFLSGGAAGSIPLIPILLLGAAAVLLLAGGN